MEIFRWYDIPIEDCFPDGGAFQRSIHHLAAPPVSLKTPLRFDPAFDPKRTELLSRMIEQWGRLEGVLTNGNSRHRYGYIGLSDRRMVPLLRPGSVVLVDVSARELKTIIGPMNTTGPCILSRCTNGYRCGWFHQDGARLLMQPHPLSHVCRRLGDVPEEAEVVGRVVGVVTRLNEPWNILPGESPAMRGDSSRKAP